MMIWRIWYADHMNDNHIIAEVMIKDMVTRIETTQCLGCPDQFQFKMIQQTSIKENIQTE